MARLGRLVGERDLPGESKHHRDSVFSGGDGVAERRVHNDDAASRSAVDIDIVDADPGAADDFEVFSSLQNVGCHLGGGPDGKAIIFPNTSNQLLGLHAGDYVGFHAASLEDFDGTCAQAV